MIRRKSLDQLGYWACICGAAPMNVGKPDEPPTTCDNIYCTPTGRRDAIEYYNRMRGVTSNVEFRWIPPEPPFESEG